MNEKKNADKRPIPKAESAKNRKSDECSPSNRDPETNVYIPGEDEVRAAKEWVEFCKL